MLWAVNLKTPERFCLLLVQWAHQHHFQGLFGLNWMKKCDFLFNIVEIIALHLFCCTLLSVLSVPLPELVWRVQQQIQITVSNKLQWYRGLIWLPLKRNSGKLVSTFCFCSLFIGPLSHSVTRPKVCHMCWNCSCREIIPLPVIRWPQACTRHHLDTAQHEGFVSAQNLARPK